ncbi:hypothetical protein ACFPVS_11420 [Neisseria weixii]|nr:hypothetical protein [Neisseria weixii]
MKLHHTKEPAMISCAILPPPLHFNEIFSLSAAAFGLLPVKAVTR